MLTYSILFYLRYGKQTTNKRITKKSLTGVASSSTSYEPTKLEEADMPDANIEGTEGKKAVKTKTKKVWGSWNTKN